ncbi:hypothetical protein J6J34_07710 [Pseudidiomarina sp. 1ASP75-14]|uniref:hypothetical protein n=1 Tax=Pseudidiomarina terrestris TaxID=2820060 RepID=UPI00264E770D|nr:hypothetical protein [Pseudidiomarina sp. 1ASP75-14]MDN7138093.1 hypothetical protein [Pseudidiomarina sp. 1ASP75-14]
MNLYLRGLVLALVIVLAGCASPTTTNMIGTSRTPLQPEQVTVYTQEPACFEPIALVTATSDMSFTFTDQAQMDVVLERLREAAGRVGANGVLLQRTGEERDESVHVGTGVGRQSGSVGFGVNIGKSFGLMEKTAEAAAIWVSADAACEEF